MKPDRKGRILRLVIRLLVGKHYIVVSNLGRIPFGVEFCSCIPVGPGVLLINTYLKPKAEPATKGGQ